MSFAMFVTWVLVGLSAGLLAGLVMKRGGYGLKRDISLGRVGSVGANVILRTFGVLTGAGIFVVAVVALIGAAIPIVAQRKFWPTESAGEEKTVITVWRWGLGAAVAAKPASENHSSDAEKTSRAVSFREEYAWRATRQ